MDGSLARASLIALVMLTGSALFADGRPPLLPEDLYRLEGPQSATLLPGHRSAVFVRRWIDHETRAERFSLWRIDESAASRRALESGELDARGPVVSPDGRWIVVRSTRRRPDGWEQTPPVPPESDPATDLWFVAADGSRTVPLAGSQKPYGRVLTDPFYARVAFSPDGTRLVFVADDGRDPRTLQEREADVHRVRPDQGEGYTGYGPAQIWIADLAGTPTDRAATQIRRITDDQTWYGDPQWTPDGQSLICQANKSEQMESVRFSINRDFDLWRIDATSGEQQQLTRNPGPDVSPRIAPDGQQVAYLTVPRNGPHMDVFNLAVLNLTASGPRRSGVLHDHHQPSDSPPHPPATFPLPDDVWDGHEALVYSAVKGVRSETVRVDLATGKGQTLVPADDASPRGERVRALRSLTPAANSILRERALGEDRIVTWTNDGLALEGTITVPPPSVAQAPFPLVVYPHGGPHSRSTLGFNLTAQVLAGQGYLVFQPNFRGSAGYGRTFLDADRNDLGGGDHRDILTGIESLIHDGLVNRERQFVYGVSYGGFMTTWLVGHQRQFRAAVAQNAVTHLDVMWGLSDLPSWTEWEFAGKPWEVADAMRSHSPFTYLQQVETPTLILHSRDDRRCPLAMGRMFYQGLQACGVPSDMVVYPAEGHGIRQPRHQVDVLQRTLHWFRKYDPLRGIEIVTLGDSITKGYRPGVRRDETFAAQLESRLNDEGLPVRVTNVGIGGERTDQALARLDRDVIARRPRIVTIMYGTNDSYVDAGKTSSRISAEAYRDNLRELVRRLRAADIQPVLMTEPRWGLKAGLNGVQEHPNLRLELFLAECRAVAAELEVPLVDHYAHWTSAEQSGQILGAWTTDQCHPNFTGHRALADTMLPVVRQSLTALPQSSR
jgi:dipeptidyl aminopeptidase/acylaminoacyl peptidase/lysophospholipase L1-like esterase